MWFQWRSVVQKKASTKRVTHTRPAMLHKIACSLIGAKALSESMLDMCQLDSKEQISVKVEWKHNNMHIWKTWKYCLENGDRSVFYTCILTSCLIISAQSTWEVRPGYVWRHLDLPEWVRIFRPHYQFRLFLYYSDVIMTTMASQITSLTVVHSIVYSDADKRKHQNSALLAFVRGIHRWPVNSPHKGPVTRKMLPFDDVTM